MDINVKLLYMDTMRIHDIKYTFDIVLLSKKYGSTINLLKLDVFTSKIKIACESIPKI